MVHAFHRIHADTISNVYGSQTYRGSTLATKRKQLALHFAGGTCFRVSPVKKKKNNNNNNNNNIKLFHGDTLYVTEDTAKAVR